MTTITRVHNPAFQSKPIKRELLEALFNGAQIDGFWGFYWVRTPHGDKVKVMPGKIALAPVTDNAYRAVVLMVRCWGSAKVRGSREAVLTVMAHAEAWGQVDIQPDMRSRAAIFWRWLVFALIIGFGWWKHPPNDNGDYTGAYFFWGGVLLFHFMKWRSKKAALRRLETSGYLYPRQAGGAGFVDEEELRRQGLI